MNKDEALNKFTFMMEYRNLSSNTIHMYRWYLSRMFDFYQLEDVSILDVSMAQNYVVHMKQTYAPASLNAVISAIRYFFDVVLESPLSRRQFPNILYHPVEITVFTDEQIHLLLDTKDIRLRAFLLLGLDAGLRVGEVARLKVSDIDSKNMLLSIQNSKRGKSRKVPLSNFVNIGSSISLIRMNTYSQLFNRIPKLHISIRVTSIFFSKSTLKIFPFMFQPCVSIIFETRTLHLCSKTDVIYSL